MARLRRSLACAIALTAGCFNPDTAPAGSDTDASGASSTGGSTSAATSSGSPTSSEPTASTSTTTTTDAGDASSSSTSTTGDTPVDGSPFAIVDLSARNCAAIDVATAVESHRGGVAVFGDQALRHGIPQAVRVEASSLASPATVPTPYAKRELMFNDLESAQTFLGGNADGPRLGPTSTGGAGNIELSRLFRLDARGRIAQDPPIILESAVTLPNGADGSGIYHGFGEVGVFDGSSVSVIDLDTGEVDVSVHAYGTAPRSCANGLHYGLLENEFGFHYLSFFSSGRLMRAGVSDAIASTVTDAYCFWVDVYGADAGFDSCAFTLDINHDELDQSRWIAENPLYQETSSRQTLSDCRTGVYLEGEGEVFSLGSFPEYECTGTDPSDCRLHDSTDGNAGIGFGPVSLVGDRILYTGDTATVSYPRTAAAIEDGQRTGTALDSLVTDLETGTAYVFAFEGDGVEGAHAAGAANQLVPLDASGAPVFARSIALSQTIPWGGPDETVGLFSGRGRVLVHTGSRLLDVDPVDGTVINRGNVSIPDAFACPQQAFYGVGELADGDLRLAYRQAGSDTIVRRSVSDESVEVIAEFADLADTCSFAADPGRDLWFFSHSGPSTLSTSAGLGADAGMPLGSCEASFDIQ